MKHDSIAKVKEDVLSILNQDGDKSEAIFTAMEKYNAAANAELVQRITEEAQKAAYDEQYAKSLGLRTLSADETKFYEALKKGELKQAITADQTDIFPHTLIDNTLMDLKKDNGIYKLINFAPAGVSDWLSASKSGTAAWGAISAALTSELSATITSFKVEMYKLYVLLVIPKAIRKLALPFVDRYFSAILKEAMRDGVILAYLDGDGSAGPIGIFRTVATGHAAKTLVTTFTGFTPKLWAPVKKHLSNGGLRTVDKIYLICNPADEADYVAPALYDAEGRMISSFKNLEVIQEPNCAQGQAAFTVEGMYHMGFGGLEIQEYNQTKALDDADLIVAKILGNGRPVDDKAAYTFDVEKLVEYVPLSNVNVTNTTTAPVNTKEVV